MVAFGLTLAFVAFAIPFMPLYAQTHPAVPPFARFVTNGVTDTNTVTPTMVMPGNESTTVTNGVSSTVAGFKVLRIGEDIYPDVLDPQKASFVNEIEALSLTYEGLATVDADGKVHAGAADGYQVSTDGLTVTVHIRDGLKRVDGTPLTAKDFEFALKRAVDPRVTGKQYVSLLYDLQGAQTLAEMDPSASQADIDAAFANYGVKATDNSTLMLTFTHPVASYWEYIASMPIFYPVDPNRVTKDPDTWWQEPANHNGNGPYKFQTINGQDKIVLVANPNYWRGKPKIDRIEISYNPDNAQTLQDYKDGKLDIDGSMAAELVPQVISDTTVAGDYLHYPAAETVALAFNNTRKPFDDRNVRIAFSLALDRAGFIKDQLGGVGTPYTRWIPPDVPGNQASSPGVPDTDPAAAVNMLVSNGYAASDSTADKPKVDCTKLGEIKFTYPDSPINQARVQYISDNLQKVIGCPVTPDPVAGTEFTSLTKDVRTNPQMSLQRWVQDYPHPQDWLSAYWECGGFSARYGYCNLFLDQVLQQADGTLDPDQSLKLYELGENMLIADVPGAFFYVPDNLQLVKPYVLGPRENLSSQDAGWAGEYGPVYEYDIDLTQVPSNYPTQ